MSTTIQAALAGVAVGVTLVENDGVTPIDLTGAAVTYIFLSPTGARFERPGSVDGDATLGKTAYVLAGDLGEAGGWKFQVKAVTLGRTVYSAVGKIKVKANL